MNLGGAVEPLDMQLFVGEQLAIAQNYEKGTNQNSKGIDVVVMILATNIFRKEGGAWKRLATIPIYYLTFSSDWAAGSCSDR